MRDLNDQETVQYLARDPYTGVLTDATVVLTVTSPSGATTTPSVTHAATGDYRSSFVLNAAGKWRWRWDVTGAIVDEQYGEVDVAGSFQPPLYATLADFKQIRPAAAGNVDIETAMTRALSTASRRIDRLTGERQFWLDTTATARIFHTRDRAYAAPEGEWLSVDDIGSITGLIVEVGDGNTWSTVTDYQTGPENAIARRRPITKLLRPLYSWSITPNPQVRVTALWGWPSIPDEVAQATLILANRLYLRKDSPEGILGSSDWGVVRLGRQDPDVADLLGDLCLPGLW